MLSASYSLFLHTQLTTDWFVFTLLEFVSICRVLRNAHSIISTVYGSFPIFFFPLCSSRFLCVVTVLLLCKNPFTCLIVLVCWWCVFQLVWVWASLYFHFVVGRYFHSVENPRMNITFSSWKTARHNFLACLVFNKNTGGHLSLWFSVGDVFSHWLLLKGSLYYWFAAVWL